MAGTHRFLPEAASAQIKQELYEGLQSPKYLNTAFSPYSVWRPSRFLEAVSKEGMKASYQAAKDVSQLAREGLRMHPLPDLSGKTQEASEGLEHFGRLKGTIPVEEDPHSLEIMRQHFRHFCYKEIEGPRVVLSELQELCHQWLVPEKHTKEQIVDLVILEQFLTILPLEMQIWVCKSSPATCTQALELAEGFLLRLQDCEQKGSGLVEEAFVHSPASERELSDAVEICISAEEEEEAVLMGTSATPVAEAGTSQVETPVPGAVLCGSAKSPPILQVQMPKGMVQDQAQQSKNPPPRRKVPWSGFEQAFTYVRQKGKNLIVQCNYCLPAVKNVSSAITSSSNLKKHLERAHPEKLILIESAKRGRRRGYSEEPKTDDNSPAIKMLKQPQQLLPQTAVERWGCGRESVTQRILDKKIIDFIVEETLPLQIVDKPSFVRLVLLGLPKDLTIMCAATLKDRIEKRGASMRDTLTNRMGAVEYVATTADCWVDCKKTFLGVTAHWISPTTLKREFAALACKRVKGSLTQPILAKTLRDIHMQYRVHNKVASTTLDSGSNFSRALQAFRGKELEYGSAGDDGDECSISHTPEDARVQFVPISELLHTGIKTEKEVTEDLGLPPHQRCVSHTLSLVATQDLDALISDPSESSPLSPFRKHFSSLMGKCAKLWSKQTQSAQFAQYIHQQCGVYLKVPNHDAGWNATFEALKQLSELLLAVPLKMDTLMDQCSLARITPAEGLAVQEYTEIMGPLAQSLDILQRENGMFMGYLLPTLYNLDRKLQGLENKPVRYTYCFPLLRGLREALRRRFAPIWEDRKLLLAACLHPRFKVDWLESAQTTQTNRYMMEALVKAEIRGTVGEDSEGSSEKNQEGDSLEDDFFNIRPRGRKSAVDIADEEVSDYLKCPSREVSSLHAFPRVMQTFLKYNTGLPSSAAVHRLFGTESSAVTINGFSMCDKLFEQLVLLKQNKAVF